MFETYIDNQVIEKLVGQIQWPAKVVYKVGIAAVVLTSLLITVLFLF
ncbi:MAG: hypothetical protein HPY45_03170 [Anaerolineae bacterium]|nr:hypothetical protein [Anaerolineae bacterium]